MNPNYDKPFKSFEELISILKSRNLVISDDDFAINALKTMSYYDLINGYKNCFSCNDIFYDNTSIEFLYMFRHFDIGLENILFKYSLYVENRFKNILAYVVAKNISIYHTIYLSLNAFKTEKDQSHQQRCLKNLHKVYQRRYVDQPTKHYFKNKGNVPPWILFKNATFSDSVDYYRFLLSNNKDEIASLLLNMEKGTIESHHKNLIINALTLIRKFRNKIAHNLQFINYRANKSESLQSIQTKYVKHFYQREFITWSEIKDRKLGLSDPYAMFNCLFSLLGDSFLQSEMAYELKIHLEKWNMDDVHKEMINKYLSTINFPSNIIDRLDCFFENHQK